ncbi:MAG: HAD-IIB family hydrolase [Erythrobacter sp.]
MHIVSLALGGCLRAEPVPYGITEDTGGHITYILGEMAALAAHSSVSRAEIVTRRFDDPALGAVHNTPCEILGPKCVITRIHSGNSRYLAKDELFGDRAAFTKALIAELRSRERLPALIHAHFADAADVAAQVERALGIPYVYTAHSLGLDKRTATGSECPTLSARIAEEDRAIAGASAVIGSSRDECERQLLGYRSARADRIHRILPGTAPARGGDDLVGRARDLIAPFLRDPDKPVILAIARPVAKKNLRTLVEAFGRSKDLRESANLVILAGQRESADCGEAEQVAVVTELLAEIDRHDLYGSVAYPRTHDCDHVSGLYCLAAQSRGVFVNPALIEPFGLTVIEAASHGLPVVATRIGGPLDTVSELEHGLLVDPRDSGAIGKAIATLLNDRTLWQRCSDNGREGSRAFSWNGYAEHFVRLASRVIAPHAPVATGYTTRGTGIGPGAASLFVSDMDNTLTGCADGVAQLHRFLRDRPDFGFAIATGRSLVEARRVHREWDLPDPAAWITSVGSEIYWETSDGLLRDPAFPALASARWDADRVEAVMDALPGIVPQPAYEQRQYKRSYFYIDIAQVAAARRALEQAGLPVRVIPSHGRFLDVLPVSAGKAAAMMHVAETLRIARSRIFAAGDSGNDEDMLAACDNAIIVSNHSSEIAGLILRPNVYLARGSHAAGVVEGLRAYGDMAHGDDARTDIRKRA